VRLWASAFPRSTPTVRHLHTGTFERDLVYFLTFLPRIPTLLPTFFFSLFQMAVGQRVSAFHPKVRQLHTGTFEHPLVYFLRFYFPGTFSDPSSNSFVFASADVAPPSIFFLREGVLRVWCCSCRVCVCDLFCLCLYRWLWASAFPRSIPKFASFTRVNPINPYRVFTF